MKSRSYAAPEGGTEMLFAESAARREAEGRIRRLFEARGYNEVVTPTLEYYDLFREGAGALEQSDLYILPDRTGRLMALRPDSTKPIARLYASRLKNPAFPVRLYYNQPVFRRNIALSRKLDETMQIGAELLGRGGTDTDLEAVSLALEALSCCGNFLFELSHIGVFRSLIRSLGVSDELAERIRELIAAKNDSVLEELLEEERVAGGERIRLLARLFGGREVLEEARAIFDDPEILGYLNELAQIMAKLEKLGFGGRISFDLGLVNEYNYYTGLVFKGYTEEGGEVLSGGRYDSLYADFGLNVDAVGFAVNLDALSRGLPQSDPERTVIAGPDAVLCLRRQRELTETETVGGATAAEPAGAGSFAVFVGSEEEAREYARRIGAGRVEFLAGEGGKSC